MSGVDHRLQARLLHLLREAGPAGVAFDDLAFWTAPGDLADRRARNLENDKIHDYRVTMALQELRDGGLVVGDGFTGTWYCISCLEVVQ